MAEQKKYAGLDTLRTFLDNLKSTFASFSHSHTLSDITDYTVDSQLSSTSINPVQNKVINTEFQTINQTIAEYDTALENKADTEHSHDDKYYTETEIDTLLANKADADHTHDEYVTDVELENLELISTEDVDSICGTIIQVANANSSEVTF